MTVKRTQGELVAELTARFGPKYEDWAFICPACGDVASAADFRAALDSKGRDPENASEHLGQICIGRILGAPGYHVKNEGRGIGRKTRGCDWAAFGLFAGPDFILIDGREVPCFEIAPAPEVQP